MKLLHIDTSILGANSVSRQVSAAIVARLSETTPGLEITYRDLGEAPLGHLSGPHIAAAYGATPESPALVADLAAGAAALTDFLDADIVVIGAPMYNFSVPTQLKAWIDRILVAGKTFRYSETGVEGLAAGKRVIVAISRGNYYSPGAPAAAFEHAQSYLRTVFGFIGITDVEFIVAEGIQVGPEHREKALASALAAAAALQPAGDLVAV